MNKKVLFVRHAESEYNLAQRIAKNSEREVRLEEECLITKFSPTLIDAPLTEAGKQQCDPHKFDDVRVELVVTSPLRRSVQTAHLLFKDHPNKPKFVAEPYLREMVLSSCDIGGRLLETMNDYPFINYDRLLENQFVKKYPNLWSIEFLYNKDQAKKLKEYIGESNTLDIKQLADNEYNKGHIKMAEYMSKQMIETFEENDLRVQESKKYLHYDVPIVCVSHSRTIHGLSGKFISNVEGILIDV